MHMALGEQTNENNNLFDNFYFIDDIRRWFYRRGYNGVPMNYNWIGFVIFTVVGITFGVMAIKSMEGDENGN